MNKERCRGICKAHRVTYDPSFVHFILPDLSSLHTSSFHEVIFYTCRYCKVNYGTDEVYAMDKLFYSSLTLQQAK